MGKPKEVLLRHWTVEHRYRLQCGYCNRHWECEDSPVHQDTWHCPHCGAVNRLVMYPTADWQYDPPRQDYFDCGCGDAHPDAAVAVHWRGQRWKLACAFEYSQFLLSGGHEEFSIGH